MRTSLPAELPTRLSKEAQRFAADAVRQDAHAIGWMPWQFYEHHAAAGTLITLHEGGDLVGFSCHAVNRLFAETRILQVWVRPDARMIENGTALIARVAAECRQESTYLRLWCAEDLEANEFWRRLDFRRVDTRLGRGPRPRKHLLWIKPHG